MDRETIIRRGVGAERLLGDESVMQALGDIEADLFTDWAATNPVNVDGREAIYRQIKSLELFQSKLETWRDQGKIELANSERDARDRQGLQVEA